MATESGIDTPTAAERQQFDRTRKGKRTSNAAWASATDPEARITRMKDGRTHLAYKPEHPVDLDTGASAAKPRTRSRRTSCTSPRIAPPAPRPRPISSGC